MGERSGSAPKDLRATVSTWARQSRVPAPEPVLRPETLASGDLPGLLASLVAAEPPVRITYCTRPGDSLRSLAQRTGFNPTALTAANGLPTSGSLREGQVLVLPTEGTTSATSTRRRTPTEAPAGTTHVYQVQPGDTLTSIATRNRLTRRELLTVNRLDPGDPLRPGQRLRLPGPGPRSATTAGATGGLTETKTAVPTVVLAAASINRRALARRRAPTREQVVTIVATTARTAGVPQALALAVATQESGLDQRRVSPLNAIGVMQITPSTGRWVSAGIGRRLDLLDLRDNITAGVILLAALLTATNNDESQALAGYCQGLASVREHGLFPDTERTVRQVLALQERFAAPR